MKKIFFSSLLLFGLAMFTFSACCDDDDDPGYCSEPGVITEIDYRDCACCGGWFIEIGEETWRAMVLPGDFTSTLDPQELPLPVFLEWQESDPQCLGDEIEVMCIRRQ